MLTAEQRAEVKALADAATPGPWDSSVGLIRAIFGDYAAPIAELRAPYRHGVSIVKGEREQQANAKFIAAAREAIPALLADLEEAEARIKQGRQLLREEMRRANECGELVLKLEAELAATKEELEEWRFTNKVDELCRRVDRAESELAAQLEQARREEREACISDILIELNCDQRAQAVIQAIRAREGGAA